jgi:acyl-CoA thioester hydrolase
VKVVESGKASLTFDQAVMLTTNEGDDGEESSELLCQGRIKIACLDASSFKPRAIPAPVRQEIFSDG